MKNEICYYVNNSDPKISAAVKYILDHLGRDYNLVFQKVHSSEDSEISIGDAPEDDFLLASGVFKAYFEEGASSQSPFSTINGQPVLARENKPDYILSSFVLLSGMQEWVSQKKDKWGRFPYKGSFQ